MDPGLAEAVLERAWHLVQYSTVFFCSDSVLYH